MSRTTFLGAVILAAVFATQAGALMIEMSPEQLAASADAIVRGQVGSQESRWNSEHTAIVTDVTVKITENWVGNLAAGANVVVTIAGGEVAPIGMDVEDQPTFAPAEDVVLFLQSSTGGAMKMAGDAQGKFAIAGDQVVGLAGLSYPLDGFRQASVRAASNPQGGASFPPGEQGPPLTDDNFWSYCGQKWFPARLPYTWFLNSAGAPSCTYNDTQIACQAGFNAWMCASGVTMNYGGSTGSNATNHSDGLNVLAWEYGTLGSGTIALCTRIYYIATNEIIEIDIEFNTQYFNWSCSGSASAMDVESIATHEEGHTLCLSDLYGVNDSNKTMYGYGYDGNLIQRSLHTADALGAEWIYPHTRPNFTAATPGGWSNPLVPRNSADSNGSYAPLPGVLDGNTTSYVNAAMTNNGGDCAAPQGTNNLYLDDDFAWWMTWGGVWGPGFTGGLWTNLGTWVRGGRHTLNHIIDTGEETLESNEGDNAYALQYVWSPLYVAGGAASVRPVPPNRGFGTYPNSDGQMFVRNGSYAWVTSLVGLNSGDDYDLYVYDDYFGSTAGFSNLRGSSAYGGNSVDFVVGHYSGTPTTLYPAEIRYAITAAGYYASDQIDASGRNATDVGTWPSQYMADYRLTDVYEGYLTAGTTYYFHLGRTAGSADIAFEIFPSTSGGIYSAGGAAGYSYWVDDATDVLEFTPSATGWHPIVVYRTNGLDPWGLIYDFSWDLASAGVPDAPSASAQWSFSQPTPNPTTGNSTLRFELPTTGPVRLAVYDAAGRRVRGLVAGSLNAGPHEAIWDGKTDDGLRVASGVYWARLEAQGHSDVRMVTILQ